MKCILASLLSFAGIDQGDPFAEARSGVLDIYVHVRNLLEVVIILAAMFILVRVVIKIVGGDRDAAKTLLWWVIGLAFGFVMLEVLYRFAVIGPLPM